MDLVSNGSKRIFTFAMDCVAILPLLVSFTLGASCLAAPVRNPTNGHYYERAEEFLSWPDAKAAAETRTFLGVRGHLATITSQSEHDFVRRFLSFGWIGGFQASGSVEPDQGWQWITGEPFVYASWFRGEPNNLLPNCACDENAIETYGRFWNDLRDHELRPFIIEYPVPEPDGLVVATVFGIILLRSRQNRGWKAEAN